jgi:hypothetical protein
MKQYKEALDDAKFKKVKTAVVSVAGYCGGSLGWRRPFDRNLSRTGTTALRFQRRCPAGMAISDQSRVRACGSCL